MNANAYVVIDPCSLALFLHLVTLFSSAPGSCVVVAVNVPRGDGKDFSMEGFGGVGRA
jgi:hypothetical protein